jgi:hypothetical protein
METRKHSVTISCPVSVLRRKPGPRKCKAAVSSIRPTFSVTNWGTSTTDKATSCSHENVLPCCLPVQRTSPRAAQGFVSSPKRADRIRGPTWPPTEWVPEVLSPGVNQRGEKLAAHLHLVPRFKNEWSFTSTPLRLQGVNRVSSILLYGKNLSAHETKYHQPPPPTHTHTNICAQALLPDWALPVQQAG